MALKFLRQDLPFMREVSVYFGLWVLYFALRVLFPTVVQLTGSSMIGLLLLLGTGFLLVIFQFHLMFAVYHDAPEHGRSENWWIALFLLGPLGLILYILVRES